MDTNDPPQDDIQGPITRARARQLNLQVSSFLSNVYCESENRFLPNDLIVLRNKEEDQQGRGEDLGGVEDQQGSKWRPKPIRLRFSFGLQEQPALKWTPRLHMEPDLDVLYMA